MPSTRATLDGIKGLYHLDLVDEVTQFQFVGSLERIETPCLGPVLEALLQAFPFLVRRDSTPTTGSELINRKVAAPPDSGIRFADEDAQGR